MAVDLDAELDHGLALIEKSLSLNPNSSSAWVSSCFAHAYLGDPETALEHFAQAQRLNPLDTTHHVRWNAAGIAHFVAGRYEEASVAADKTLNEMPTYPPGLRLKAGACGVLGRTGEGRKYVQRLLAVNPTANVHWQKIFWERRMRRIPRVFEKLIDGLRVAGLPEK